MRTVLCGQCCVYANHACHCLQEQHAHAAVVEAKVHPSQQVMKCSGCSKEAARSLFSKSQRKKTASERKCKVCAAGLAEATKTAGIYFNKSDRAPRKRPKLDAGEGRDVTDVADVADADAAQHTKLRRMWEKATSKRIFSIAIGALSYEDTEWRCCGEVFTHVGKIHRHVSQTHGHCLQAALAHVSYAVRLLEWYPCSGHSLRHAHSSWPMHTVRA